MKRPAADDWPVLMRRSQMDNAQAAFYQAMWYAAGVAWAYGVADEALTAVCDVTLRATEGAANDFTEQPDGRDM